MDEVAVREVQLDRIEAEAIRAPSALYEGITNACEAGGIEGARWVLGLEVRHRRGGNGLPATWRIGGELRAAVPRRARRGLATGMRELDADRHRAVPANLREDRG